MGRMAAPDPAAPFPAPWNPPRSWFSEIPDWFDPDGGLIQFDWETGRVAAMVAPYGDCILDGSKQCWSPPVSNTGYEYAHVGTCVLEDGETIRVATIGGGVPHASLRAAMSVAQDHYANTATRKLVGRYVDSPEAGGIVFLGSAQPGLTYADVYDTLSSAVSGDWRWIPALGSYEMVGAQLVNSPGFRPVPGGKRVRAAAINFLSGGPKVAAAKCGGGEQVYGEWVPIELESTPGLGDRVARLAAATAALELAAVVDEEMPPARTAGLFRRKHPLSPAELAQRKKAALISAMKRRGNRRLGRYAPDGTGPKRRTALDDSPVLDAAKRSRSSNLRGLSKDQARRIREVNRRNLARERAERTDMEVGLFEARGDVDAEINERRIAKYRRTHPRKEYPRRVASAATITKRF